MLIRNYLLATCRRLPPTVQHRLANAFSKLKDLKTLHILSQRSDITPNDVLWVAERWVEDQNRSSFAISTDPSSWSFSSLNPSGVRDHSNRSVFEIGEPPPLLSQTARLSLLLTFDASFFRPWTSRVWTIRRTVNPTTFTFRPKDDGRPTEFSPDVNNEKDEEQTGGESRGELSVRTSLERYDSPYWPEALLVVRS